MAVSPDALICVRSEKIDGPATSPKDPRHAPPASAVHRLLPKMRKAPGRQPSPAHMAGRDQRRRSPAERKRIALALRPESLPMLALAEQKRCSSNDRVPAASRHLSANADSTLLLLGFRRSYLFTSTLHHFRGLHHQHPDRLADVVQYLSLWHDRCTLLSCVLYTLLAEDAPIPHRRPCH